MTDNSKIFGDIAGAGESNDYAERIPPGAHALALNNFEVKDTQDHGKIVSVDFIVLESSVPGLAGKAVGEAFFIGKSDALGGKGARQRAFSMAKAAVLSLGGNPDDQTPVGNGQTKGVALVQSTLAEMAQDRAPWRGLVLRCDAKNAVGKKSQKAYTQAKYSPIVQTVPEIQAVRAKLEKANAVAAATAAAAQAAQPAAAPTTSMLGAPAVAPDTAPAPAAAPVATSLLGAL